MQNGDTVRFALPGDPSIYSGLAHAHYAFVTLRASRFRDVGQRVFLFDGMRFDLGIPTTITITPLKLTAGMSRNRYEEVSAFSKVSERLDARFSGYHVPGGVEVRLARWLGAAAEAQWATVPDALGDDLNSVSHEFEESNLGGMTFRLKVVVGR